MFLESSRHNWHCSPPHPRQVLSMHFETHVEMVLVSSRQSWHCSPPQPRHWLSMQSLTVSAALPTNNANRKRRDILRCSGWRAKSERRGQNHLSQCYSYINRFSTSKPNFHEFSTWQTNMKTASSTASRSHKSLVVMHQVPPHLRYRAQWHEARTLDPCQARAKMTGAMQLCDTMGMLWCVCMASKHSKTWTVVRHPKENRLKKQCQCGLPPVSFESWIHLMGLLQSGCHGCRA